MTRKYRLTLLFLLTAAVVIAVATFTVNVVVGSLAEDNLIKIAEADSAREAIHVEGMIIGPMSSLAVQLQERDAIGGVTEDPRLSAPLSLDSAQFYQELLQTIPTIAQGLNIAKISLFDNTGRSVWSTDPGAFGILTNNSDLFEQAQKGGVKSRFVRDERIVDLAGVGRTIDVVQTYLPLMDRASGETLGIAEIYRDVTGDVAIQVDDAKLVVLWTTIGTMGGLFFVLVGFVVVADVSISRSRRREMWAAEEANRTLEDRIMQRTQDLENTNEELLQAQSQLVRTEKLAAIGELAGSLAHDLRNPLGAINNAVYYLKQRLAPSEVAKSNPRIGQFLGVVEEEVEHSNRIISDLMAFARVNPPSLAPINLTTVVESAISEIQLEGSVNVVKTFEPDLPEVMADGEQLRRVFANLAKNGQEAMPEGGELIINGRKVNAYVEVTFTDTGVGISEEIMNKIFDPLFTTKSQGTGLGLSVCHQIVSKHGGTMDVLSVVGEGATFVVRLPSNPPGSSGGT